MSVVGFLVIFFSVLSWSPPLGEARTCWANPSGSGTACTQTGVGTPCTLTTAVSECTTSGDTITLEDGTYNSSSTILLTTTNLTFQSENRHQGLINRTGTTNTSIMEVRADGIHITGIHIDGNNYLSDTNAYNQRALKVYQSDDVEIDHTIIEESLISMGCATNCDSVNIHNNYIHDSAMESTYLRAGASNDPANITNGIFTENLIVGGGKSVSSGSGWGHAQLDLKGGDSWSIHHNMFVDKTYTSAGDNDREASLQFINIQNSTFEDNIAKNHTNNAFAFIENLRSDNNVTLQNNVFEDVTVVNNPTYMLWYKEDESANLGTTVIDNNTWCDAPDDLCIYATATCGSLPAGLSVPSQSGLPGDADDADCVSETSRILSELTGEMGGLPAPSVNTCEVGGVDAQSLIITWDCPTNCTPPLSQVTNANIALVGSVTGAFTESSSAVLGSTQTDTTLAETADGGETLTLTVSFDAVRNSAAWGGDIAIPNAAEAGISCTNNVTGGGPAPTLTQANFAIAKYETGATGTTWRTGAALGTALNKAGTIKAGGKAIIVIEAENTADEITLGLRLRYNVNGGGYVNLGASCAAGNVCVADHMEAGIATAIALDDDGGNSDVAGELVGAVVAGIPNVTLATNSEIDTRYAVQFDSGLSINDVVCFRLYRDDGTALDSYDNDACVTIRPGQTRRGS